jgi:hypothetical protein
VSRGGVLAPACRDLPTEPAMTTRNFLSRVTGSFAQPAAENPTVAMIEAKP